MGAVSARKTWCLRSRHCLLLPFRRRCQRGTGSSLRRRDSECARNEEEKKERIRAELKLCKASTIPLSPFPTPGINTRNSSERLQQSEEHLGGSQAEERWKKRNHFFSTFSIPILTFFARARLFLPILMHASSATKRLRQAQIIKERERRARARYKQSDFVLFLSFQFLGEREKLERASVFLLSECSLSLLSLLTLATLFPPRSLVSSSQTCFVSCHAKRTVSLNHNFLSKLKGQKSRAQNRNKYTVQRREHGLLSFL